MCDFNFVFIVASGLNPGVSLLVLHDRPGETRVVFRKTGVGGMTFQLPERNF